MFSIERQHGRITPAHLDKNNIEKINYLPPVQQYWSIELDQMVKEHQLIVILVKNDTM